MIVCENQITEIHIPSTLPMKLEAHYDIAMDWWIDPCGFSWTMEIKMGYIALSIAGKHIDDLEGSRIPSDMRDLVLTSIQPLTREEAMEFAKAHEDERHFIASHQAGMI